MLITYDKFIALGASMINEAIVSWTETIELADLGEKKLRNATN